MPTFTVKVKWGKETFSGVEVSTDEEPALFKAQIFALTGVDPARQKVMCKGVTLRDNSWGNIKLSNGAIVLVMGSKEEDVPQTPVQQTRFVEDMNDSELASAMDMPEGLVNLGNTCYMNATVQCLKTVPELTEALGKFRNTSESNKQAVLTDALAGTVAALEGAGGAGAGARVAETARLLGALHAAAPRFAEQQSGPSGGLAQQDASECWSEIVHALQRNLPAKPEENATTQKRSLIDQYFGGTFDVELVCTETTEEPPSRSQEAYLQLSCFISQDVKYLQTGLKSKMQEQITKLSETLGRNAIYTKTSKISRLPAYLTVQFVRFYYKEKESINAKILKDVKFPLELDVYELCSPELQERLAPMRTKFKEFDDANAENPTKKDGEDEKKRAKQEVVVKQKTKPVPYWFSNDVGSNNSGFYRLQAVLTHRGRSSSSGHYVAWVRRGAAWLRYDDDAVTPVTQDEVLKLSGGGDWHCAYMLVYGPRILELPEEEEVITAVPATTS